MSLLVTSFFTATWEYPAHAMRLCAECDALGIDHHVAERPDAGDYLANCRQKPVHTLETLDRFERPVLWVDVDASILRLPEPPDVDFGACRMPEHRDRVWHVATLYFAPTPKARDLLARWIAALDEDSSDEAALDRAWASWPGRADWRAYADLGPDYMNIEGRWVTPEPIVMHRLSKSREKHMAHRKLKQGGR